MFLIRRRRHSRKVFQEETATSPTTTKQSTSSTRSRTGKKRNIVAVVSPPTPTKPTSTITPEKPTQVLEITHDTETVAVDHFSRGLLRVAMYNDNVSLPGSHGKLEPFAHVRHCHTGDIPIAHLLKTLRRELNVWWYGELERQAEVRRLAAECEGESDTDSVSAASESGFDSDLDGLSSDSEQDEKTSFEKLEKKLSPGMRVLLVAMVYVDRLTSAANGRARLCSETMHRLVLCAVQLSAQVMWSKTPSTKWFAAIAGVEKEETRELKQLFWSIAGDLSVSTAQFRGCVSKCVEVMN